MDAPRDEKVSCRRDICAYGVVTTAVAALYLFIELMDFRSTSANDRHSAMLLVWLWAIALFNGVLLLARASDRQWLSQLRRKSNRQLAWTKARGFDLGNPLLWSVLSAVLVPASILGPQTSNYEPLFSVLIISSFLGAIGISLLVFGKVMIEGSGIAVGTSLNALDNFLAYGDVKSVRLSKHLLTVRSLRSYGRIRSKRLLVVRGAEGLRQMLPKVVPPSVVLDL